MVVYEKIYSETYINNENLCLKNNTAQLYFKLLRADLHWNVVQFTDMMYPEAFRIFETQREVKTLFSMSEMRTMFAYSTNLYRTRVVNRCAILLVDKSILAITKDRCFKICP